MNHSFKQSLAWIVSVGISGALFGGASFWLPQRFANHASDIHQANSHEDGDGELQHEKPSHELASEKSHHELSNEKASDEEDHQKSKHEVAAAEKAHHNQGHEKTDHNNQPLETSTLHQESALKSENHQSEHAMAKNEKHSEHEAAWSYQSADANGPSNWGGLSENFSVCEKGMEQSPIDIKNEYYESNAPKLEWHYGTSKLSLENNGHTIQAKTSDDSHFITIGGEKFTLAQFHFHTPSEHRVGGVGSDLEVHFVHKNAKGSLAVVGVLVNELSGQENKAFKPIWDLLPRSFSATASTKVKVELSSLLPKSKTYAHYNGSLTTPPCAEGVRWFVLKAPLTMSGAQIEMYGSIFEGPSNRPVQPLQGRDVITNAPPLVAH